MRFSPHLLVILHIKKAHIDYNRGSCETKRNVQVARRPGMGQWGESYDASRTENLMIIIVSGNMITSRYNRKNSITIKQIRNK